MISLREKAPEGLLDWVKESCAWVDLLIYKTGWVTDWMTGLRSPCIDASCSACGQSVKLEKRGSGSSIRAAWWDGQEYRDVGSYEECYCPECGKRVRAIHTSAFRDEYDRYAWPFTIERQGEALIVYLWRVRRGIDKQARSRWTIQPWEAYVYEGKKATRCKHWSTYYFGNTVYADRWIETKKMQDTAGDAELFWCPEGITEITKGTAMENSKLELYMQCSTGKHYPVTWLRLYQRHKRAENLMTCGLAEAVTQILDMEKCETQYYGRRTWNHSTDMLRWVDWKQKRPTEMLRIGKEEIGYFSPAKKDSGKRLRAISRLRADGYRIRCGEENGMALRHQRDILDRGLIPAAVEAYLKEQRCDWVTLSDYWNMAQQLGNRMEEKRDLLPKQLREAHDRCQLRQKTRNVEHLKGKFEKRFQNMSRYRWEKDGILIRPAETPAELILEGERLHHCVGSYAERHAEGKTTIMLIRRESDPDTPWYTLEFDEKNTEVRQNRGERNCARTEEISRFEEAWLEWVRAGCIRRKETHAA